MIPANTRQLRWLLPLALYAVFLWRTPYSLRIFPMGVLDWVVPVVGLSAWIAVRWRRHETWPRTNLDAPLLIWLVVTTVSIAFSTNMRRSLLATWDMLLWALILWGLVDAARRQGERLLWRVLYLVGAVVCMIGAAELLAWYFGWPLLPTFQQGWFAIGGLAHPLPPTVHRVGLALVNITALSAFIAMLIPPAISILVTTQARDARLGMGLWLITAGGILLLSLSRGGFLALGVSLPFLLIGGTRSPQFRRRWSSLPPGIARALLVGTILLLLAGAVGAGFLLTSLGDRAAHAGGDAVRLDLWRSAWAMLLDHSVTGVGPGAYGIALRAYRDPLLARDHILTAHNLYLNVGAEMGVPGLVAGAWLLLTLAWAWWRRWRAETPGSASWWRMLGIGAALAGLAAQSFVDTFVESAIVLTVAFFVALILAPQASRAESRSQGRRWPWALAWALLILGAMGLTWDAWGQAQFVRAVNLTKQGAVEDALSAVERARKHDPWMPLYTCHAGYLYGLQTAESDGDALATALDRYWKCLAETPVPGWTDHLNLAALLWQAGQETEARTVAQETTAQTPLEWMPWLNRGLWAEMVGDREEAVSSYRWVLCLDPELAGSPFWQQGERAAWWDEIVTDGEQGSSCPGSGTTAWRWQVLVAAGRFDEATRELEAWLADHPGDTEAMVRLGEALTGMGRPEEALVWLDKALDRAPANAPAHLLRGEAALAIERYDEAEQDLRMALFLEPGPRVHLALARLAQARGNTQAALLEYSQALRPVSLSQNHYLVLFYRMGWPALLPQVAQIGYRQDGDAVLEWGRLLEQQGDTASAQQVYRAALNLDLSLDQVRQRLQPGGSEPLPLPVP